MSPNTGKEDCFIIDIVDSTSDGLLVTPTLLGLTHDEMEMESERLEEEKGAVDETSRWMLFCGNTAHRGKAILQMSRRRRGNAGTDTKSDTSIRTIHSV